MEKSKNKKVIKHLKGDIETFKHEAHEDRKLIKSLKNKPKESLKTHHRTEDNRRESVASPARAKVGKVMREYKRGELHSGSKKGPKVTNPKQAIAISLSEAGLSKKKSKKKK